MPAIFISYRREDAEGEAGRLFDDLVPHFAAGSVFMDVAVIQMGRDFRKAIDDGVATCDVFLAVIGKSWSDIRNEQGQRRLEDLSDFVRIETASALKRDVLVIPILVRGAKMPRVEQLPDDIKGLADRNACELTHAHWSVDLSLLVERIRDHLKSSIPKSRFFAEKSKVLAVSAACVLGSIGFIVWHLSTGSSHQTVARGSSSIEVSKEGERSFSYSLLVKAPGRPVQPLAREMVFPAGYRIKFRFVSELGGSLYIVNEGPPFHGTKTWTWLFPDGNSQDLLENHIAEFPQDSFLRLDDMQGREKVYLIWSEHPTPELEQMKTLVLNNVKDGGEGRLNADQSNLLQETIKRYSAVSTVENEAETTIVRGRSSILVREVDLEHL